MTRRRDRPADDSRAGAREWAGLAALALPTMVIGLDMTVLHMAAPSISADLRPSAAAQLWIVDIYGFAVAGLLLTMGNVGDRIGRRRLLMLGAVGFAIASALAAFASSPGMLIAARALLGVAGATLMPSTLSLIRDLFVDDEQRTVAVSVWLASLLGGSSIGPLIGGAMLERFWWGSVFLLAIPVMVGLLVVGPRLLPPGEPTGGSRVDPVSVALSLLAVLPVVYAIKDGVAHGASELTPVLVVLGVAAGAAFLRRQGRLTTPLMDRTLFRDGRFGAAVAVHLLSLLVLTGTQFLVALYLQLVEGLSPLAAGLWTLPSMVFGLLGAVAAPFVARRLGPGTAITVALPIGVVALVPMAVGSGMAVVVPGFALLSFALNFATALTTDKMLSAAPARRAGMASGIGETASELGIALGVALLGSLAVAVQRSRSDAELVPGAGQGVRDAFAAGLQVSAGVGAAVLVGLTLLGLRWLMDRRRAGEHPHPATAA